jgi:hypothetical protein
MGIKEFLGLSPKDIGEGVKAGAEGLTQLATGIRSAVTGELPPETQEAMMELAIQAEEIKADLLQGQQEIESQAIAKGGLGSLFLAGWRPFIGWTAAWALFIAYIPPQIGKLVFWVMDCIKLGALQDWPATNMAEVIGLVGALLGMGTLRTIEKQQGTVNEH